MLKLKVFVKSIPLFLSFGAIGALSACVSGAVKHAGDSHELPGDLPQDLKERFRVKEGAHLDPNVSPHEGIPVSTAAEPALAVADSKSETQIPTQSSDHNSKKNLSKNKKKKGHRELAVKSESNIPNKFQYPTRRPSKDPLWVGEKLVYSIDWFKVRTGDFTIEVKPHKTLGDRKVYHLQGHAVSSPLFTLFYRLNDMVESFVDYDGLFSHRFHILLDETKQKRDSLELNDSEKKQTYYWNRWDHKTNGFSETKQFSPIESFSQDSMSALYYIRTVPLPTGAVVTFPVVSEGHTWEAICTVLRREVMDSPMGKVQTIVIHPDMKYQGILKKTGESYLWLTDDDRRIPVRLEAKVRIGSVVAKLKEVEFGTPPETNPAQVSKAN